MIKTWLESNTLQKLSYALLYWILIWGGYALSTGAADFKLLGLGALAIITPMVQRLSDPDIVAPLAVFNRNNLPSPDKK